MKQSFQWNMNVHIEYAEADIEVQSNCVTVEIEDFEADTTFTMNADLIDECLSIDELIILKHLCIEALDKRSKQ
tara:strand:- start:290 stop:511 length:222 start_codon:yes stop_codon:yes gene_type:complete